MDNNIPEINELIKQFSKLPGLGPKSAKRIILKLINNKDSMVKPLAKSLAQVYKNVVRCADCGNLKVMDKISAVQNSIVEAFGAEKLKARSLRGLYQSVLDLKVVEFDHFENEEAFVLTLVREQMTYDQQLQLTEKLLFDSTDQNENWIVDFLFSVLDDEESRLLQELISEIKG